jgi:hypothetical protein
MKTVSLVEKIANVLLGNTAQKKLTLAFFRDAVMIYANPLRPQMSVAEIANVGIEERYVIKQRINVK